MLLRISNQANYYFKRFASLKLIATVAYKYASVNKLTTECQNINSASNIEKTENGIKSKKSKEA